MFNTSLRYFKKWLPTCHQRSALDVMVRMLLLSAPFIASQSITCANTRHLSPSAGPLLLHSTYCTQHKCALNES